MLFHIIFTAVVLFDIHIYAFVAVIFKKNLGTSTLVMSC